MTIHIVAHQKGGIGKSFLAVALVDFLRVENPRAGCYDLDIGNAILGQFVPLKAVEIGDPADTSSR